MGVGALAQFNCGFRFNFYLHLPVDFLLHENGLLPGILPPTSYSKLACADYLDEPNAVSGTIAATWLLQSHDDNGDQEFPQGK